MWRHLGEAFPAHENEVYCWPFEQNIRTIPPERHPDYPFEVRRFFQITASAVAIVTVLLGTRYAYSRESVHGENLYEQYRQVNRESFDAKLPYVSVSWTDLSAQNSDGITSFDDYDRPVSIELDRQRITSERDLRAVIRHNACHVSVGGKAAHGPAWQRCMDRFRD
jgi:SprT-like family protein